MRIKKKKKTTQATLGHMFLEVRIITLSPIYFLGFSTKPDTQLVLKYWLTWCSWSILGRSRYSGHQAEALWLISSKSRTQLCPLWALWPWASHFILVSMEKVGRNSLHCSFIPTTNLGPEGPPTYWSFWRRHQGCLSWLLRVTKVDSWRLLWHTWSSLRFSFVVSTEQMSYQYVKWLLDL